MSQHQFDGILGIVSKNKTMFRDPISAVDRLAVQYVSGKMLFISVQFAA